MQWHEWKVNFKPLVMSSRPHWLAFYFTSDIAWFVYLSAVRLRHESRVNGGRTDDGGKAGNGFGGMGR
jgi:hypothetical protein